MLLSVAGGLLALLLAVRKATRQPHVVTLSADALTVLNQATGLATHVPFNTVKQCRFRPGRGNVMLQLDMRAGGYVVLSSSTDFEQFGRMAQAVQASLSTFLR